MARAKRSFIIGAVFVCIVSTLLLTLALATNSWISLKYVNRLCLPSSRIRSINSLEENSSISYGLFTGWIELRLLITPQTYDMHMICTTEFSACAVTCKTTPEARLEEVIALAQGYYPSPTCTDSTVITSTDTTDNPNVINMGTYITTIVMLSLALVFSFISIGLALLNVFKNPTDPKLGIFGIQIACGITGLFALGTLAVWGAVWAGGLSSHLAFAFIAAGTLNAESPRLGYSYWLILLSIFCSIGVVALLYARQWILEREPPPPSAAVKDDADGTIFLY